MATLPPEIEYGYVTDWRVLGEGDGADGDRKPDARIPSGLTVTLEPKNRHIKVMGPIPGGVHPQPVECTIGTDGYLADSQGAQGVWLITGQWTVTYKHPAVPAMTFDIEVLPEHTEEAPLYLSLAQPPGGTPLTPSEYAELAARIAVLEGITPASIGAAPAAHTHSISDVSGLQAELDNAATPQTLSLTGSDLTLSGSGGTVAIPDPTWGKVQEKPSTFPPEAHTHTMGEVSGLDGELSGTITSPDGVPVSFGPGGDISVGVMAEQLYAQLTTFPRTVSVSTGAEARPPGAGVVFWIGGTTQPSNMAEGDIWFEAAS